MTHILLPCLLMTLTHILLPCLVMTLVSHSASAADPFMAPQDKGTISDGRIDEASGMVVSRTHNDLMYTHNDKGGSARIFAVKISTGETLGTFNIRGHGVVNYDWEDLAYGPCVDDCKAHPETCAADKPPSRYCIYIGDIGDHHGDGAKDAVYMVREPGATQGGTLDVLQTLTFTWTELDAETLMIDPTGQMYVVSKVKGHYAKIIQLPMNGWRNATETVPVIMNIDMTKAASIQWSTPNNDPQGGEISPDGTEMVMVAEHGIWYWSFPLGDVMQAARAPPTLLSNYVRVPSCEAIAWNPQGVGFYTLAEGSTQTIKFYQKRQVNVNVG